LLREVRRMEGGEKRVSRRPPPGGYERELRLAGLAQRVAQAYTIIEGVLAFVARRIDRVPVTGEDWHKKLISRCAQPFAGPKRPALGEMGSDQLFLGYVLSKTTFGEKVDLTPFFHFSVRNDLPGISGKLTNYFMGISRLRTC